MTEEEAGLTNSQILQQHAKPTHKNDIEAQKLNWHNLAPTKRVHKHCGSIK